jgi:hypothetical protein
VDYTPVEGMEDVLGLELLVKVVLYVRSETLLAETPQGCERINVQDIGVVLKLWNKSTNRLLREIYVTKEGQRFCRNPDNLVLTCKVHLEKIPNPSESLFIMVNLRKESNGQPLLDPLTKLNVMAQKSILRNMFFQFH